MILCRKQIFFALTLTTGILFLLNGCSSLPIIGKKKEKEPDKVSAGKTVSIVGMDQVEPQTPSKKPSTPAPVAAPKTEAAKETKIASAPTRPFSSPLPLFQSGYRKKIVILDFENKTTYKEEKIGEAVAKKLSDKLDATQRTLIVDENRVSELLNKEGLSFSALSDPPAMKRAHQSLGIQAFVTGTVTDVSLLSSKKSDGSEDEASFATSKVEVRLIDSSTGNLLKTFIGRSPIFGTREAGDGSRGKAVEKAIDLCIDEIMEGFLRYLDLLEWSTSLAKVDGSNLYINAGKLSGLRIGDTLEIYEPGIEIIHPATNLSLGWTTGKLRGAIRVSDLFGVDAAIGKIVQGQGFAQNDVVKSTIK
jgi:curli biogenesis system outer membrane secretion channel CsgG